MAEGQSIVVPGENTGLVKSYLVKRRWGEDIPFFCILPEVAFALQRLGLNANDVTIYTCQHGQPTQQVDPRCYGLPTGPWKPKNQIPTIPILVSPALDDVVDKDADPWGQLSSKSK